LHESVLVLQLFMSVVAVTMLTVAATNTQRRRTEETLRASEERLP
jgi:hypothetical protein